MSDLTSQGYRIIPSVIGLSEIEAMRNAITETIDRVARVLRAPFEMSSPDMELEDRFDAIWRKDRSYAQALFRTTLADAHRDERIEAIAAHAVLSARISESITPLKRTGHLIRTRASIPVFSGARTRWHQDVLDAGTAGCGSVRIACWIPLMDVDENTGALEVIPGSWENSLPHEGEPDGRFFITPKNLPEGQRRVVPLRRGDVLILDRFIPHRALPVLHSRARWTVVMWVKASDAHAC